LKRVCLEAEIERTSIASWEAKPKRQNMLDPKGELALTGVARPTPNAKATGFGVKVPSVLSGRVLQTQGTKMGLMPEVRCKIKIEAR
jgi:hypothetical protein